MKSRLPLPLHREPTALTAAQTERYDRHLRLHEFSPDAQARLAASRVFVIGTGGLGSPILLYLAGAGVGTIGIGEDDVIDTSNLHRQVMHSTCNAGSSKAQSAAARIRDLNPDVEVLVYEQRLTADSAREIFSDFDLVIDASDNFPTRYMVDDVCTELGIPRIWGVALEYAAHVSVFWGGETAHAHGFTPDIRLRDVFPTPPPAGVIPTAKEVGVFGALCGQAGTLMANEAIKLITGVGEVAFGDIIALNSLTSRTAVIPIIPRTVE